MLVLFHLKNLEQIFTINIDKERTRRWSEIVLSMIVSDSDVDNEYSGTDFFNILDFEQKISIEYTRRRGKWQKREL